MPSTDQTTARARRPARLAGLLLGACAAALTVPAAALAAPANDDRASAQRIGSPVNLTGTTAGASLEDFEPTAGCGSGAGSVWYAFTAAANSDVVVNVAAAGEQDVVVDAFRRVRSQMQALDCAASDDAGRASVEFAARKGQTYLVRVSRLPGSDAGQFALELLARQPAARPPGPPLPRRGAGDSVNRILNPSDAWSARLVAGRTYKINLAPRSGACMPLAIYGPGTGDFEEDAPVRVLRCGGYTVLTPGAGEGGRYSFLVSAPRRQSGTHRYRLAVARAARDDLAPGSLLPSGRTRRGTLNGGGIDVVDVYRFDLTRRSSVELRLGTARDFSLSLVTDRGRRLAAEAGSIERRLGPGRYFVAVRANGTSAGRYALTRVTRAITSTSVSIDGPRTAGSALRIGVRVSPAASGPVTVVIERFDPFTGWRFAQRTRRQASGGRAAVTYRPPAIGRYRARAVFHGSRTAAGSESGWAYANVASSLRP